MSQSRSNVEIDISPPIFELERRSKIQNIGITYGYLAGTFNFWYNIQWKSCRNLKIATILKILKYWTHLQFDHRYEKTVPNYVGKVFFIVMTSSMTSKGGLKFFLHIHVEVGSGSKLQGQGLVNKCKYRYRLSRLYMSKENIYE